MIVDLAVAEQENNRSISSSLMARRRPTPSTLSTGTSTVVSLRPSADGRNRKLFPGWFWFRCLNDAESVVWVNDLVTDLECHMSPTE
jgi:hypothetical protein